MRLLEPAYSLFFIILCLLHTIIPTIFASGNSEQIFVSPSLDNPAVVKDCVVSQKRQSKAMREIYRCFSPTISLNLEYISYSETGSRGGGGFVQYDEGASL